MPLLTETLRASYQHLFDTCAIRRGKYEAVDRCVQRILNGRTTYESIETVTGVPWYFTGILHNMESDCNFSRHLHNGDPLTARTVQVPRGRPLSGTPPFTFSESAADALTMKRLSSTSDWTIPGMLYSLEKYNGFGYRTRGIPSPYLWGASYHYSKGKYVADGIFDPQAVTQQIGAAVLLRRMSELQVAVAGTQDVLTLIRQLGAKVHYRPATYHAEAERLQKMLNSVGQHLRVDGLAGRNTSDAFFRVSGQYLKSDPKAMQPR
jgi:lysozyme family protein